MLRILMEKVNIQRQKGNVSRETPRKKSKGTAGDQKGKCKERKITEYLRTAGQLQKV